MKTKAKAALAATIIAGTIYVGVNFAPISQAPAHEMKPAIAQNAHYIDEAAIIGELKAQGEIVGGTLPVEKRVTYSADKWYGDKTVALTAIGTAKLGVKSEDIDVSVSGDTVTVRMPAAQVLSLEMPFDDASIDKDVGALRKQLTDAELQALYGEAREGAMADIERNRQAFDDAEDEVAAILKRLIGEEYVKFEEAD